MLMIAQVSKLVTGHMHRSRSSTLHILLSRHVLLGAERLALRLCRELWFRASLAWQQIFNDNSGNRNTLLVAHNAVNQALVATAIGLPPTYFRRLLQNNAATTVLDFQPTKDGPPRVYLDRLNQVKLLTACVQVLYGSAAVLPCHAMLRAQNHSSEQALTVSSQRL